MRLLISLSISVLFFTTSCVTSQESKTLSIEEVEIPEVESSSKIVILNFDIIKSKNDMSQVSLTKTEVISGKLDKSVIIYPPKELSKLIVHLLDENQQVVEELVIKKPYLQIIEQYEEGGEVELQNDEIEENKFSVHFNQNSAIKSVKIFKIKDEKTVEIFHEVITQ